MRERLDYIDFLEFLGMLFVLIYHSEIYTFNILEDYKPIYYVRYFLRTVLSTCVPLFFFSNGYLLLNRELNIKKHGIKVVNLIILAILWGLIDIVILAYIEHEFLSLKEILIYLWDWHHGWINHFWYLGALVCIYIFFPVLKVAFDEKRNVFICFTAIIALLTFGNRVLQICGTIFTNGIMRRKYNLLGVNFFNMFNPFRELDGFSCVYFCIGGLAHCFKNKIESIGVKKRIIVSLSILTISCIGLLLTGVVLSEITREMWDVVWEGYDTLFTFMNVCAFFILSLSYKPSKDSIIGKYILNVSLNTLGIFCMHPILVHLTRPIVKEWIIAQNYIGCVMYSLIIMTLCLMISLLFRKIPILKNLVVLVKYKSVQ